MEEIVEVPSYFLCPISMQMMQDPVTVSTGITYDRESIEKWIFSCNNVTCPATNQKLQSIELIPNHTLRRLIQSWCTLNESNGFARIPTPKPSVEKSKIIKLINEAITSSTMQLKCLQDLRSIAYGCQSNKNNLKGAGIITFLASLMKKSVNDNEDDGLSLAELALDILSQLDLSEVELKKLMWEDDGLFLDSLIEILKYGDDQFRGFAMVLITSLYCVADPKYLMSVTFGLLLEVVNVLRDNLSMQVSKAALKFLVELCPWGRNRIKVVEVGAIWVLIELLLNSKDKRQCELMLVVLDQLCQCAEGRSELLKHGAGMAIVSKKILRVSHVATDRAVRVLSSISKFSADSSVLQEMLQVGVVAKLCLVLQLERGSKTKERAHEILKLHSRVWKESPCIPINFLSS
ncbi:hypothetical protein LIER_23846 [Lithospermum erythrorhizon]|uniref:U-box domain-containing protein n=1 Tax=Lithospermum erythrorhizon TaxID=34254 RepID=A0AAV3QZ70_LITER